MTGLNLIMTFCCLLILLNWTLFWYYSFPKLDFSEDPFTKSQMLSLQKFWSFYSWCVEVEITLHFTISFAEIWWKNNEIFCKLLMLCLIFYLHQCAGSCSSHGKCTPAKGSFNNYVDIILPFFDQLPTRIYFEIFTLNVDTNR